MSLIVEEIMMTQDDAFKEARRIASETGQGMFVFSTRHYHRNSDRVIEEQTHRYHVGLIVPVHGVQVGTRVTPYAAVQTTYEWQSGRGSQGGQ
jgi:hypothetical protein